MLGVGDVYGFDVGDDLANDARGGLLLGEPNHLLEALLDEASQVDNASVAAALDLVVLEEDVGAEELDRLINDVVRRCVRAVRVLRRDLVQRDAAGLFRLLAVELRVISDKNRLLQQMISNDGVRKRMLCDTYNHVVGHA